jgi:protoheme IX farnesyltransferase
MLVKHYLQLAKIRVTAMVLATTAVGYVLGSSGEKGVGSLLCEAPFGPFRQKAPDPFFAGLWLTLLGTGLAVVGAAAFNQLLEIDRDAKMRRTRNRPLPAGAISRTHAFLFALVATAAGLGILNEFVNPLTSLLGLANVLLYTLVYTPLKPRTSLSTLVGAVCGALPPVMGWTGAADSLSIDAALLGLILFVWQIPHFLSFVWLYREEYANAGYRMLPVTDPDGRLTCLMILLYSLALMPLGLVATFQGMSGYLFAAGSLGLGLALFLLAVRLRVSRTERNARQMFRASIAYLPLLLALLVADRPSALISHQVHHDEQHAPNGVQEVPIDGRISHAGVVGRRVAAGPGAAGDDGQRTQSAQHVRGVQARENVK